MLDFGSLRTPSGDAEVLLEPVGDSLRQAVERNGSLARSWHYALGTVDLSDVRKQVRSALASPGEGPVLALGHQCEFMHPGVWAKHVAARAMGNLLSGRVVNLVLDHDVIKSTALSVPVADGDEFHLAHIPVVPEDGWLPYESIRGLDEAATETLGRDIRFAMGPRFESSAMGFFLDGFRRHGPEAGFAEQMIGGREGIDRHYGVNLTEHRVSRAWDGALVAHVIAEAGDFAAAYNRALGGYRRSQGIRGTRRPIADLEIAAERIELPIWCILPGEKRRRVFVRMTPRQRDVLAEDRLLGSVSVDALRRAGPRGCDELAEFGSVLRPKALLLTLWARLFLADYFIHGIGGAKYDRITDRLIADYFELEPPAMGCVSATLRLGLDVERGTEEEVREAERRLRDLSFNPQRYVQDAGPLKELLEIRASRIARSEALRQANPRDRRARRAEFEAIRDCNARILALAPGLRERQAETVTARRKGLARARLAEGREYFVGLYPRRKLDVLADRVRSTVL